MPERFYGPSYRCPPRRTQFHYHDQTNLLLKGGNALLESPTGTGKTLCLLSAALAWRSAWVAKAELAGLSSTANYENYVSGTGPTGGSDNATKQRLGSAIDSSAGVSGQNDDESFGKSKVPLIIYASRTHSQLAQVVKELSSTVYRPKISVIGSREQLCINPAVKAIGNSNAQQALCQQLVKKKGCQHYTKVGEALGHYKAVTCPTERGVSPKLMDIEDLVKFGQAHQACPYFLAREGNIDADVLFMPYNYLIDRKARGGLGLNLENAVIIFDEAHNLEGFCGDASSFDLSTDDLRASLQEVNQVVKLVEDPLFGATHIGAVSPGECKTVQAFILSFLSQIMSIKVQADPSGGNSHYTARADCVFDMVQKCGISNERIRSLLDSISGVAKIWIEDRHAKGQSGIACHLQVLETVFRTLYKPIESEDSKAMVPAISGTDAPAFRVYITEEAKGGDKKRTLSLWCFNPGMALRELTSQKVRSVILASGTLSPLTSFAHELQLTFGHQLENTHVINPERQLFVSVLRSGPTDVPLNSSYGQRDSVIYKTELGLSIARVSKQVPDGLLVFFPSYAVMESCLQFWKTTQASSQGNGTIWAAIGHSKTPFVEPRNKSELPKTMEQYGKAIDSQKGGAIFFAVCRGKISEGVDFSDAKARAVIVTGIPFPPVRDPKVMLKRDYLQDIMSKQSGNKANLLSGEEWYGQQASRAVNQAIGRVIRHRNDYGAILFFDDRFGQQRIIQQLSKWVRPYVKPAASFNALCSDLAFFFRSHSSSAVASANSLAQWNQEAAMAQSRKEADVKASFMRQESLSKARAFFNFNPFHMDNQQEKCAPCETIPDVPMNIIGVLGGSRQVKPSVISCLPVKQPVVDLSMEPIHVEPDMEQTEKSTDIQHAKEYLALVRSRLTEEASSRFNSMLKSYKAKKVDCSSLIDALLRLYHEHDALDLAPGFRSFVSVRNQALFDGKLADFKESFKGSKAINKAAILTQQSTQNGFFAPLYGARPHISTSVKIEPITQKLLSKRPPPLPSTSAEPSIGPDICPICREKPEKPFKAKCSHVCCFSCWTSWLGNTLECPVCRQRTRLSQLSKIF